MLYISHYWRHVNQNYGEVLLHTNQNGQHQKNYKLHKCWRGCREKGTYCTAGGMPAMENSMEIS